MCIHIYIYRERERGRDTYIHIGDFASCKAIDELHEHKTTGETYAMKGISKGYIAKTGMQKSVMNEKEILLMMDSPFIIKLDETYNGAQTLYFLMEL